MSINDDILYKIDSEIGKDKEVVKLRREIDRLNQEIICLNNFINELEKENKQLKKELHTLKISEEQWLEETLGSDKE